MSVTSLQHQEPIASNSCFGCQTAAWSVPGGTCTGKRRIVAAPTIWDFNSVGRRGAGFRHETNQRHVRSSIVFRIGWNTDSSLERSSPSHEVIAQGGLAAGRPSNPATGSSCAISMSGVIPFPWIEYPRGVWWNAVVGFSAPCSRRPAISTGQSPFQMNACQVS
jgi:hypothetical protein